MTTTKHFASAADTAGQVPRVEEPGGRARRGAGRGHAGHAAASARLLLFGHARAHEELPGVEHPAVWTAERDKALWDALRG